VNKEQEAPIFLFATLAHISCEDQSTASSFGHDIGEFLTIGRVFILTGHGGETCRLGNVPGPIVWCMAMPRSTRRIA
jgi:hypothetical protein